MKTPYDDIIHLPHHVSRNHPQMPHRDRSAQFAPFAALTGYEAALGETARQTAERRELDPQEAEELNCRLAALIARLPERPEGWRRVCDRDRPSAAHLRSGEDSGHGGRGGNPAG